MLRQAFAGMLWSKQFFHFDVDRWLVGDPAMPTPPPERLRGRNKDWRHLDSLDVLSMPDTWEYPWFASWDLAFHCVALAHVDGDFAKRQLLLLLREWYQHPNGQLPAYEWAFGDANPPVHAWAAFQVFLHRRSTRLRVPQARAPQAAHQLHLVGEPKGRSRQQRLRRRLPRARQHRPDRPRGSDATRPVPRTERRHRVDGALLPRPARDRGHARDARPCVRRRGDEVLRALQLHRHRDERPGPLARARRLLLRRHSRRRWLVDARSSAARWSG